MNLGSYYLVGVPAAILFAFVMHIGGKVIFPHYMSYVSAPRTFLKCKLCFRFLKNDLSSPNRASGWGLCVH